MNLLLLEQGQISDSSQVRVSNEKARYLLQVQKVKIGQRIKLGEIHGSINWGNVEEIGSDYVVVQLDYQDRNFLPKSQDLLGVSLILAMPRPQMFKRILQTVATMGITRLIIIRSKRCEKSYFSSPVLAKQSIDQFLQLGLEQGVSTYLPEVIVRREFVLPDITESKIKLAASPGGNKGLGNIFFEKKEIFNNQHLTIAIGPEGGWDKDEIKVFIENGFELFNLGQRILRVETAVTSTLAQIRLLRDMAKFEIAKIEI